MTETPTPYAELADVLAALPLLVRETRRRLGLSRLALGRQLGISNMTVSRVENGEDCVLSNAVTLLRWIGTP